MTSSLIFPDNNWRMEPVGDHALLVRVAAAAGLDASRRVHAVTGAILAAALPGVLDVVPAFTTVAVYYDIRRVSPQAGLAFRAMRDRIQDLLARGVAPVADTGREVRIPACYGGEFGPDLEEVALRCGITPQDVIDLHCASAQTVYTFFFAPGNPFAGPVNARLAVPRRATPRTLLPAGSVAIANGITTIYQTASPGGWNIIARTPWRLFDVRRDPPLRLRLGDRLRFEPISPDQYLAMQEAR